MGEDTYGNCYYEAASRKGYQRLRRWVMYNNYPEASTIPPEWHGWLHHQTNSLPDEYAACFRHSWQKPPAENPTGTNYAYKPRNLLNDVNYEAWRPEDSA